MQFVQLLELQRTNVTFASCAIILNMCDFKKTKQNEEISQTLQKFIKSYSILFQIRNLALFT